jgi:replication factor C small subunit
MIEHEVFVEKYRPKNFDEFIGVKKFERIIELCKDPFKLPHFLFISKPGSGKTTLAKIIIKNLNADYMILNASDETGIDTIRGKVKTFAKNLSIKPKVPKIIFFDEADFLSANAQAALRGIIEDYSRTCRFILAANYEHKIIDALQSRLTKVVFGDYKKEELVDHLIKICEKENIKYDSDAIVNLVNLKYPDIRSMVKSLQSTKEVNMDSIKSHNDVFDNIFLLIQKRKLLDARQMWVESNIDCRELLYSWFQKVITMSYNIDDKKLIVENMAEFDYRMAVSARPDIQMFAFCTKTRL